MSIEGQGRLTGMGGHQSAQMLKDEWLTPPEIIEALGGPQSFDLDPCAPITRPWEMAKEHYTVADNGLLKPWHGRVWFNPPYGGPKIVGPWMRRMVEHGVGTALIFARTETDLFFETIWTKATSILFLRGRLHFHHVDGKRAEANAGAPSILVAYGEEDDWFLQRCPIAGQYIPLLMEDGGRRMPR
ncbi:DNA N-6-adenine-methyltransferase [Bradyrhizobium sp. URHD0069]|uniref:DNA N-6-adenine-methyltransferase n=1 Tax=Bradyrhizobium sp. URHD0069 TaxID=1380355 RepID=UPI000B2A1B9F|nr:DNA N-6-adenine-methyltransferase [Bradyrhizobium sp. URHD0069]